MNYSDKSNDALERQHREHRREKNLREMRKIEDELEYRGYEINMHGYATEKEASFSTQSSSSSSMSIGGIIGLIVGVVALSSLLSVVLLSVIGGAFIVNLSGDFLEELRPYFPLNEPYSIEVLKTKLSMAGILFLGLSMFPVTFLIFSLITKRSIKIYHLSVPFFILASLSSFFVLYKEYPLGEATLNSTIIFIVTYIVAVAPIRILKYNWLIGLYTIIISTGGFIISGNSLLTPYIVLISSGLILFFSGGRFYGCGKKETSTPHENVDAA